MMAAGARYSSPRHLSLVDMEGEFGTGLRAHIERTLPPDWDPERLEEVATAAETAAYVAALLADLEERERKLTAAEAELAYREQRLLDREGALVVASQRVSAEVVEKLLETARPVEDELARARARRRGHVA